MHSLPVNATSDACSSAVWLQQCQWQEMELSDSGGSATAELMVGIEWPVVVALCTVGWLGGPN